MNLPWVLMLFVAGNADLVGEVRSRGTRVPIPFAQVSCDGGEPAQADADGRFQLSLPAGRRQIEVRAPGFRAETFEQTVTDGTLSEVRYALLPERPAMQTVVRDENKRAELGRVALRGAELSEVPGTGGDPFKAVTVLPGVSTIGSGIPLPVVRGSNPAATGVFFDGVRIPQLFHSFLGPSVINPNLIDGLDFHAGGAPVSYGNILGGVIDARPRKPQDGAIHAVATADLLSASAFVEVPISATGTSITIAGRHSYTEPMLVGLSQIFSPGERMVSDFWDYHGRIEQKAFGGTLRLLAMGNSDSFGSRSSDGSGNERSTGIKTVQVHRVDLRYRHSLGPGTAEVAMTVGEDRFGFLRRGPFETGNAPSRVGVLTEKTDIDQLQISGRLKASAPLDEVWRLTAGATVDHVTTHWTQSLGFVLPGFPDYIHRQAQPEASGVWVGGWLEVGWTGLPDLSVTAGVRVDLVHQFRTLQTASSFAAQLERGTADPRLSLRYQLNDALWVRASTGLYHQAPSFMITLPVVDFTSASHGFQEVVQNSAGVTWRIWRGLELSADAYVNPMLRLVEFPLLDDERTTGVDPFNPGFVSPESFGAPRESTGLAYGADLMLRWPLTDHFFGWLTLSLQQSTRHEQYWLTDGAQFTTPASGDLPSALSQTVVANAVLSYRFDNGFSLGATLHFNTGRPESGQLGSRTHVRSGDDSAWRMVARNEVDRLPPYFRADLRVAKTWLTDLVAIEAFADVLNVTVQQEATGFNYVGGNGEPLRKTQQGVPLVVPTIGARVKY